MQSHQRGQILILKDAAGPRKERPILVVSPKHLNGGDTIRGIPFGSQNLEEKRKFPTCVHFAQGEFGLDKDCASNASQLAEFKVNEFKPGVVAGVVSDERMLLISRSLCAALGIDFHELAKQFPE
jgi:mRNA-degrading endonuclease toxin of MazEF toxin-antitoxin module